MDMKNVKDYYRTASKCPYIKQSAEKCPFLSTQIGACPFLRNICDNTVKVDNSLHDDKKGSSTYNAEEEQSYKPERLQPLFKGVDTNGFMVPMVEKKEPVKDAIAYYSIGRRH